MIAVQHLSMRLTAAGRPVTILDDVTLEIPSKQTVAVMGPSGSGKSTLLGLMAGLDRPTAGAITLDGTEITSLSESRMAKFRRAKIGYIFQSFHLIPTLTALENVLVPLELSGNAAARDQAIELLQTVGLGNRIDHYPVQLSGGEQQRVAVARALPAGPQSYWPTNRRGTWIHRPGITSWILYWPFIVITGPPWCWSRMTAPSRA